VSIKTGFASSCPSVEPFRFKLQEMADSQLTGDAAEATLNSAAKTAEALREGREEEDHEGEEDEDDNVATGEAGLGGEGAAKAKKKRKPKKKKKSVDATGAAVTETNKQDISQLPKPVPVHDIPALLQQLALGQPAKKEGKAPEEYKFWNTQPVPKFREPNLLQTTSGSGGEELPEGAILPDEVCKASIRPAPEPLLADFQWCDVDLEDKDELHELYELLYSHYVEDKEGSFRFNYSTEFLTWALKPPGWKREWHIGVRTKPVEGKKGKLVAFIAGTPAVLRVRSHTLKASEINFLIIHRKLREKRLAPLLIKEITRRCYQVGVYQALYTAGTLLPTPVSTCRYFHRSLDWEHLYKNGFSHLPHGSTETRQKYKYRVESHQQLKGLRPMKKEDIPAARDLLQRYVERFSLRQEFSEEEFEHFMCSPASQDVVWSYVVEQDDKITDFISYYALEVRMSGSTWLMSNANVMISLQFSVLPAALKRRTLSVPRTFTTMPPSPPFSQSPGRSSNPLPSNRTSNIDSNSLCMTP